MKTVVTGGAGFIGSHVVEAFIELGDVFVIDNFSNGSWENISHLENKISVVNADIGAQGSWQTTLSDADTVIHLAALADIVPSIQNPEAYYAANVQGTFNVMEACRNGNVGRVVYSASGSCYGVAKNYPTPETDEISPEYPYALTKFLGEQIVMHWSKVYNIPAISLRFFNVYGPRSRTSGTYGAMFGVFLAQKLSGIPLTVVGDGSQTRDFTFVSDVVRAVMAAARSDVSREIFNVGTGVPVSVNKIVDLLGCEKVHIPKRPGEPDCTQADIQKIRTALGWKPKVSIEQGVSELIDNIQYWSKAVAWTPESIAEETKDWFKFLGNDVT